MQRVCVWGGACCAVLLMQHVCVVLNWCECVCCVLLLIGVDAACVCGGVCCAVLMMQHVLSTLAGPVKDAP